MSKGPRGMYIRASAVSMRIGKILANADGAGDVMSTENFVFALLNEKDCEVVDALRRMGVTAETLQAEMAGKGKKKRSA